MHQSIKSIMRVATTSSRGGKLQEISNFTINLMQKLGEKNSQKLNLCDHLLFMYDEVRYSSRGLRKGKFFCTPHGYSLS